MISSGAWTLFRANALCLVRRLLPLVRANPVIFCLVVLGPVAFLAGLAWAGARDAAALAASPGDGASTAIVLTVGVLFALVGFSVRHVSSIEGSLDAQIRSAPLSRLEMFLGTVGIPFSACCLAVSVSSLVLLAPLFHAVGARPYAPVQLALFEAAAFYAAGAVGEVFARATRRRPAALLALPLLVLAWVGERSCDRGRGMAWYRWTARAHGHEHRDGAGGGAHARLALSLLLASAGVWASLVALVGSPEERTFSRAGRRLRSPGSRFGAVSSVALKRMGRNRLVRRHVLFVAAVAGTLSCLTSILLPGVARVATGGLVLLAAFSVAVVPLATYGTGRDSSWLWRSAPVPLAVYAPGMVVAGFCGGILALAVPAATATLPAFRAGGDSPALGTLAVVAAVTLLLATGTGFSCPAPWRTPPSRSSPTPCSALRSPASSPPPRGPRPGLRSSVSRSWRSKPGSCSPPPASRSPWLRDGAREEEGVIFEIEVPVFPPGVQLRRSHILDTVTGDRVPIKETARLMLSLVDGRRTAKEIGEAVAASYGLALAG